MWENLTKAVVEANNLDPDYNVYAVSNGVESFEGTAGDIHDRQQHLINEEGYFDDTALREVIEEVTEVVMAPPGYCLVKLSAPGKPNIITTVLRASLGQESDTPSEGVSA